MTPEEKALLEKTYALAKENNDLLRAVNRRARWSSIVKIGYWTVIILLSLGAAYFIQPYVDMLKGLTGHADTTSSGSQNGYAAQLQDLLK
jgi:hypothetical protein